MPFIVEALVDDHRLTVTAHTAKSAFATAVDWHVKKLPCVTISDGARTYSIAEFSEAMALIEIADTIH